MSSVLDSLRSAKKHLLTGVSYMIPIIIAGGVLFSLAVVIGGEASTPSTGFAGGLAQIGIAGLTLFIPVMGGFIAYSMADRPGIGPGMVAAYVANSIGTGFLGGMIGGFLAGGVVLLLRKIKVRPEIAGIMPIFIIPLLGSFISGGLIYFVLGAPLAAIMGALTGLLTGMSEGSKVGFGIVNGLMYAFDMGGAVNKTAYTFSMAMMNEGIYWPQGINSVACATPPLGMALAVFLGKKKFTKSERKTGVGSLMMGLVGITEGAIPFAVADPLRVIPSVMAGSAVAGGMAAAMGLENSIAWDSLIALPGASNIGIFLMCIAAGSLVTALLVIFLKPDVSSEDEDDEAVMDAS